jgi:hypothetical protein
VEAIACALTGNTVRIAPNRVRRAYEIVAIIELVAVEMDADVRISARPDAVKVWPPSSDASHMRRTLSLCAS